MALAALPTNAIQEDLIGDHAWEQTMSPRPRHRVAIGGSV
jgi:hypothetical protein